MEESLLKKYASRLSGSFAVALASRLLKYHWRWHFLNKRPSENDQIIYSSVFGIAGNPYNRRARPHPILSCVQGAPEIVAGAWMSPSLPAKDSRRIPSPKRIQGRKAR